MPQNSSTAEAKRNQLARHWYGRFMLYLASVLYGIVVGIREKLYKAGKLKSEKLDIPVICVGNLSTGGTGKTPAIITLCELLLKEKRVPAILSRGYKRTRNRDSVTAIDAGEIPPKEECGDEPLMIAQQLGHRVPVLVSPNRYASGTVAAFQYNADIAIMDDGFQHFQLKRDLNIVLVNAMQPFTRDHLLPYGNLREKPKGLERASVVIITHCEIADKKEIASLRDAIREYTFAPIIESEHKPLAFFDADTEKDMPLDYFNGKKVSVLSGIGNPESFEENIRQLGAETNQIWRYPDHHQYTEKELRSARNAAGSDAIITTFKDFARFPENWRDIIGRELYILKISMKMDSKDENSLLNMILNIKGSAK